VLVDAMRGRHHTWTRIRVNLQHVPEDLRPKQEALDPDEDPWKDFRDSRGSDRGTGSKTGAPETPERPEKN